MKIGIHCENVISNSEKAERKLKISLSVFFQKYITVGEESYKERWRKGGRGDEEGRKMRNKEETGGGGSLTSLMRILRNSQSARVFGA